VKASADLKGTYSEIPGSDGTLLVPEGWKSATQDKTVLISDPEEDVGIAITTYKDAGDAAKKAAELSKALKLHPGPDAPCKFNHEPKFIKIGPDEIQARVTADTCMQSENGKDAKVEIVLVFVSGGGLNLFILAGADADAPAADRSVLLDILRTIKKKSKP
jgi:hypothetical protein